MYSYVGIYSSYKRECKIPWQDVIVEHYLGLLHLKIMFEITAERKMKAVNLKRKISECDIEKELRISRKSGSNNPNDVYY